MISRIERRESVFEQCLNRETNERRAGRADNDDVQRRRDDPTTTSGANERDARAAVGGQLSLAGEPKRRRRQAANQPASQPAGGGRGEQEVVVCEPRHTTQPPAGLNLRRFLPPGERFGDGPPERTDRNNSRYT